MTEEEYNQKLIEFTDKIKLLESEKTTLQNDLNNANERIIKLQEFNNNLVCRITTDDKIINTETKIKSYDEIVKEMRGKK